MLKFNDWTFDWFISFMLLTCTLQEGGVKSNQTPTVREKSYTVGRIYDTMSGRVVTMTTRGDVSDVAASTRVTGERPLITICEVKTPTSPSEPVCDVISKLRASGEQSLDVGWDEVSKLPSPVTVVGMTGRLLVSMET